VRGIEESQVFQVLVVEDDLCLETIVSRVLKTINRPSKMFWSSTAEDAQQKMDERRFDLVICDFTLAGFENGLELWRFCQLKYPTLPFLMISGLPVQSFLEIAQHSPPTFLPKPFMAQELVTLIQQMLHLSTSPSPR
jgi:DNA-binding NtrC family response regulator